MCVGDQSPALGPDGCPCGCTGSGSDSLRFGDPILDLVPDLSGPSPLDAPPAGGGIGRWDGVQLTRDGLGLLPGIGIVPDVANAGISVGRGNWGDALWSLGAAVPLAGHAATAGKWGRRGYDAAGAVRGGSSATRAYGNISGGSTTARNALKQADRYLGPGYREIAPGVYRSSDGTRQFRMTGSDLRDPRQGPHVHFESVGPDGRTITESSHVTIPDS